MAVTRLGKDDKVILHLDQGSQYSSYDYKKVAKEHNITLSMSRRGNCYDNAVAESFFKTLKKSLSENNYLKLERLQHLKYLNI